MGGERGTRDQSPICDRPLLPAPAAAVVATKQWVDTSAAIKTRRRL